MEGEDGAARVGDWVLEEDGADEWVETDETVAEEDVEEGWLAEEVERVLLEDGVGVGV